MDIPILLNKNVIEDVIGHPVRRVRLHDGGIGQGLVVGQLQPVVIEVESAAHPAAVQPGVPGNFFQVLEDFVPLFLIEVLRRGGGVVKPELDGGPGNLFKAVQIGDQVLSGVVLIQHAVHPEGHGEPGKQTVVGLHHVFLHVPGDVDAGDFMLVPLREGQNILLRLELGHRQRGVDIDLVGGGNLVQHGLENLEVGEGLAAGEDKIAVRRNGVHPADAGADFLGGEAGQVRVFAFIDAEGAVVLAVVRDEYRHRRAALPRLVGMLHNVVSPFRL